MELTSQREAPILVATGWALFFSLVILVSVEKGKQRYNKTTKGNQQADYPYKYQNNIRSSHWRHLPSYVFRQTGHWLGRLPPLSWVPYWNTTTVRQEFQLNSAFVKYVEFEFFLPVLHDFLALYFYLCQSLLPIIILSNPHNQMFRVILFIYGKICYIKNGTFYP